MPALYLPRLLERARDDVAIVDPLAGRTGEQRAGEVGCVRCPLMLKAMRLLPFALATIHIVKIRSASAGAREPIRAVLPPRQG